MICEGDHFGLQAYFGWHGRFHAHRTEAFSIVEPFTHCLPDAAPSES